MERHQITGHTELIGLLAYPIRHSQSPATHNAAYEKLGVDIVNLAFEVDAPELEDAINGLRALSSVVPMFLCQIRQSYISIWMKSLQLPNSVVR